MARRIATTLGVLLLLAAVAEARFAPEGRSAARELLADPGQSCTDIHPACSACRFQRIYDGGVLKTVGICTACSGLTGYRVTSDGRSCECQPGYKYATGTCTACIVVGGDDSAGYCPGGTAGKTACKANLQVMAGFTTPSLEEHCVTLPGYGLDLSTKVGVQCTAASNSYNEGGNRRPCTPCGHGLQLDPSDVSGYTKASQCYAPAGSFFDRNQAKQCPRGTYTTGFNRNAACTPCPEGVTTAAPGADAANRCDRNAKGYYLSAAAPNAAATKCLADTYMDAEQTGVQSGCTSCGTGLTTNGKDGVRFASACVAKPGYSYGWNGLVGSATPCTDGLYKPGNNKRTACVSCGTGFKTNPTSAATALANCYILQGWGSTRTGDAFNAWTAARCTVGFYGASVDTYGVRNLPCVPCPAGMSTKGSAPDAVVGVDDGTTLWSTPTDCLTLPGYGYNPVTQTATKCDIGFYSTGGNRNECQSCPEGYTTADVGSIGSALCVVKEGYGLVNGVAEPCPFGTYSGGGAGATCQTCAFTTTTRKEQSTSVNDCAVCKAGYGMNAGSCVYCAAGKYSYADEAACGNCPADHTSPLGAIASDFCVSMWTELPYAKDVITFDETKVDVADVVAGQTAAQCKGLCTGTCMFYALKGTTCYLIKAPATGADSKIAFQNADTLYTVWDYKADQAVGDELSHSTAADLKTCTQACDANPECVAVTFLNADSTCSLRAARMDDAYFQAAHDGCQYRAVGEQMNLKADGVTVWSAPVYTSQ